MNLNKRVNEYISQAPDFAKPILEQIRQCAHEALPTIEEDIKWGAPAFIHQGIVFIMASFKHHCAINFMKRTLMRDSDLLFESANDAYGVLGKITSIKVLPSKKILVKYIKEAVDINIKGLKPAPNEKVKTTFEIPNWFIKDLKKRNIESYENFTNMAPGQKKEYVLYVEGAKREETKEKRMLRTIEYLLMNKGLNWKYENC